MGIIGAAFLWEKKAVEAVGAGCHPALALQEMILLPPRERKRKS